MLIDLYSHDKGKGRKTAATLAQQLAELQAVARVNDELLLLLHQAALLLIAKSPKWQVLLQRLLKTKLGLVDCRLICIDAAAMKDKRIKLLLSALPKQGKIATRSLANEPETINKKARSFFYLPIYHGTQKVAVLTFAAKKANAFPPDADREFMQRLAQMVAAAL